MTSEQKKSEIMLRLKVHFSHLFVHVTREYVGIYVQSEVHTHTTDSIHFMGYVFQENILAYKFLLLRIKSLSSLLK